MSADLHRHAFRGVSSDHVSHCRSPEVVEQASDVFAPVSALKANCFF